MNQVTKSVEISQLVVNANLAWGDFDKNPIPQKAYCKVSSFNGFNHYFSPTYRLLRVLIIEMEL